MMYPHHHRRPLVAPLAFRALLVILPLLPVGRLRAADPPCHEAASPAAATAPADATQPTVRLQNSPALASANEALANGAAAFTRGDPGTATADWRTALQGYQQAHCPEGQARALRNLALAFESAGHFEPEARQALEQAKELCDPKADPSGYVAILSSLGTVYTCVQRYDDAEEALKQALEIARAQHDVRGEAGVLNNLGNLDAAQTGTIRSRMKYSSDEEEADQKLADQKQQQAQQEYAGAARRAADAQDALLEAKALVNGAVAAARDGKLKKAADGNERGLAKVSALPASLDKVTLLTTIGRTDASIAGGDEALRPASARRAADAYNAAARSAEALHDDRGRSYAIGFLGDLYERYGTADDAMSLARTGVFFAQRAQSSDSLYRWQWLTARLLKRQGQLDEAIAAYQRAVGTELQVQSDKTLGYGNGDTRRSFRREVAPLFYQTADLLLQRSAVPGRSYAQQQDDLRAARDTIESLKKAELDDYFKDVCADTLTRREIGGVSPNTAIVYVLPLEDRVEVLLDLAVPGATTQSIATAGTSAPHFFWRLPNPTRVGSAELEKVVDDFRRRLERRATNGYVTGAQKLYDWIIRPIQPTLQQRGINTLVFVPDGSLRTIPMSALYDGEEFLIQKYAIAVTPGINLTDPKPLARKNVRLLINGLSEARTIDGTSFAALPNVPAEVRTIKQTVGAQNNTSLLNAQFLVQNVEKRLDPQQTSQLYPIVHIASHGEFKSDVSQTFVLTFDDKLTFDKIRAIMQPLQYSNRPVELLTLSACQTAAGDDRAALGLAGFAIKAGARSALASLWFVNDASSVELISEFYRQLYQNPTISKAEALRRAQMKLLQDPDLSHPIYWAPYEIIGNWL